MSYCETYLSINRKKVLHFATWNKKNVVHIVWLIPWFSPRPNKKHKEEGRGESLRTWEQGFCVSECFRAKWTNTTLNRIHVIGGEWGLLLLPTSSSPIVIQNWRILPVDKVIKTITMGEVFQLLTENLLSISARPAINNILVHHVLPLGMHYLFSCVALSTSLLEDLCSLCCITFWDTHLGRRQMKPVQVRECIEPRKPRMKSIGTSS